MRIFPEMWASTLWPFSSSTRNMAFGSGSETVPSRTIASSLGLGSGELLLERAGWGLPGRARRARPAAGPKRHAIASPPSGQTRRSTHWRADGVFPDQPDFWDKGPRYERSVVPGIGPVR